MAKKNKSFWPAGFCLLVFAATSTAQAATKRIYEFPLATVWDGFFPQDKPGGVTQKVPSSVVESKLVADGFIKDSVLVSDYQPLITAGTSSQVWLGPKTWGQVADAQVASGAAIAWNKISKSGAVASDVGALPASSGSATRLPVWTSASTLGLSLLYDDQAGNLTYGGVYPTNGTNDPVLTIRQSTGASGGGTVHVTAAGSGFGSFQAHGAGRMIGTTGGALKFQHVASGGTWVDILTTSTTAGDQSVTLPSLGSGFVRSSSVGLLSSSALASVDVTTALGFTPAPAFTSTSGNQFFATPNGASGVPGLRMIVAADIPALNYLPVSSLSAAPIANFGANGTNAYGYLSTGGAGYGLQDSRSLNWRGGLVSTDAYWGLSQDASLSSSFKPFIIGDGRTSSTWVVVDPLAATRVVVNGGLSSTGTTTLNTGLTGIAKLTAGLVGVASAGDFPTLNQNTTGSAATLTTGRTLTIGATGKTFNGSANVSWSLAEIGAEPAITTLVAAKGGTGQSSYAVGDLLYASTTTALSRLADVATGNVLRSGGVGVAPAWGKVALSTDVSGTLAAAQFPALTGDVATSAGSLAATVNGLKDNAIPTLVAGYLNWTGSAWALTPGGGMANPMTTTGDMIVANPGSSPTRLAVGAAGTVLVGGTIPSWSSTLPGGPYLPTAGGALTGLVTSTNKLNLTWTGDDASTIMQIDARNSTLNGSAAFVVIVPATGAQKAFQLKSGNGIGWASFEYSVGGAGKPGLALGDGSAGRDVLIYRNAAGVLRTNSALIVDQGLTVSALGTGFVRSASGVFSSSALIASEIPALDASKVTTGTFADARIASAATWNAKLDAASGVGTGEFHFGSSYSDPQVGTSRDAKFGNLGIATTSLYSAGSAQLCGAGIPSSTGSNGLRIGVSSDWLGTSTAALGIALPSGYGPWAVEIQRGASTIFGINQNGAIVEAAGIKSSGAIQFTSLSGTGTRMATVSSTGVLGATSDPVVNAITISGGTLFSTGTQLDITPAGGSSHAARFSRDPGTGDPYASFPYGFVASAPVMTAATFLNGSSIPAITSPSAKIGGMTQVASAMYTTSDVLPVLGVNEWCFLVNNSTSAGNLYWTTNSTQAVKIRSGGTTTTTGTSSTVEDAGGNLLSNYSTMILIGPTVSSSNVCSLIAF